MGCGHAKLSSENDSKTDENKKSSEESKNKSSKDSKKKSSDSKSKKKKKTSDKKSKTSSSKKEDVQYEKTNPDEENKLKNSTRIKKKLGKKSYTETEEDKENELRQDLKEAAKREKRIKKFPPQQKELEFDHVPDDDYDPIKKPFELGYEEEIHKGINFGKPVRIFNQIWLSVDLPVEPDLYYPRVEIPTGWRIPNIEDYQELIKNCGDNDKAEIVLTHKLLLNMNKKYQYITLNKVYENIKDGYDPKAWMYNCIGFDFVDLDNVDDDVKDIEEKKQIIDDTIISNNDENNKENIIKKSDLIDPDDKEAQRIFELNPYSIFYKDIVQEDENQLNINIDGEKKEEEKNNDNKNEKQIKLEDILKKNSKNNLNPKLIFPVNTFKYQKTLKCKLISSNKIDLTFKCPLVIESGYRSFFEVPFIYNISTFEWNFNDKFCSERKNTSDKFIACHIFTKPGEYQVELTLRLFKYRDFLIKRKVWVIDEITYGEEIILNGIKYGQPLLIGNQVWLDRDIKNYTNYKGDTVNLIRGKGPGVNGENSITDSVCACPNGWRLPTKDEIEFLLRYCGRNNEQRMYFFTLLAGGFLVDVNESGYYDLVTLSFRIATEQENFNNVNNNKVKNATQSNLNSNKLIEKDTDNALENDAIFCGKGGDRNFDKKLKNYLAKYGNVILNTSNLGDIFDKEVYSLSIENNKVFIGFRTTSLNSIYSFFSTRYILDQNLELDLGLKDNSFPANYQINFEINYPNVTGCEWNFGDDSKIVKNKFKIKHSYKKPQIYELKLRITLFETFNYDLKKTLNIFSEGKVEGEDTELNSKDQIFILQLGDLFKVKFNDNIHFSRSVAPIAPLLYENGFYIAFNNILINKLLLFKVLIDKNSKSLREYFKKPIYEEESSIPLDIVCTSYGCCLLLTDSRDDDLLFIEMISPQGKVIWRNNIMQNGTFPVKAQMNQLIFYNDQTKKPEFGMNAMFHPYSGRLSYGARRILCIFSYKNFFGMRQGGGREDNNGDIIISYTEDGSEVNLACPWSTTHSLTQRSFFDGRYFYTASLGDAHPANIKVVRIDPILKMTIAQNKNNKISNYGETQSQFPENIEQPDLKTEHYSPMNDKLMKTEYGYEESYYMRNLDYCGASSNVSLKHNFIYSEIVEGSIPGNLVGFSSGRLGNLTNIQNNKLAIVFSRIKCIDGGCINKNSELSLIIFNENLKVENVSHFRDGELINCIKQAKYGKNLLIMISLTKKVTIDHRFIHDKFTFIEEPIDDDKLPCNFFLVNSGGKIKSNLFSYYCNLFSPSDDFETLLDGSVVWAFVDDEDNLYVAFLPINETMKLLDRFPKEIIPASKLDEFLAMKDEDAQLQRVKREKELLKRMGIDEDDIKKKIIESEKLERERRQKELEKENEKLEEEIINEELNDQFKEYDDKKEEDIKNKKNKDKDKNKDKKDGKKEKNKKRK